MIFALEGCDGSGKSSLARFFAETHGFTVVPDPGGTPLSASLRELLLHRKDIQMSEVSMALIFYGGTSSVLEHAHDLEAKGATVVLDRTHISNFAYRMAGGIPMAHLRLLATTFLPKAIPASRIFYLDVPAEERRRRQSEVAGSGKDRFESQPGDYMQKVASAYEAVALMGLCTTVDGNRPREQVAADICKRLGL